MVLRGFTDNPHNIAQLTRVIEYLRNTQDNSATSLESRRNILLIGNHEQCECIVNTIALLSSVPMILMNCSEQLVYRSDIGVIAQLVWQLNTPKTRQLVFLKGINYVGRNPTTETSDIAPYARINWFLSTVDKFLSNPDVIVIASCSNTDITYKPLLERFDEQLVVAPCSMPEFVFGGWDYGSPAATPSYLADLILQDESLQAARSRLTTRCEYSRPERTPLNEPVVKPPTLRDQFRKRQCLPNRNHFTHQLKCGKRARQDKR